MHISSFASSHDMIKSKKIKIDCFISSIKRVFTLNCITTTNILAASIYLLSIDIYVKNFIKDWNYK